MGEKIKITVGNETLLNITKDALPSDCGISFLNIEGMKVNFETGDVELSLKKDKKFEVNVMLNSVFTLDIFNQYKLKISPSVNIDSIIIDVGASLNDPNYITLLGTYTNRGTVYANTLIIKDFNFNELAELIVTMVKLYRPTDIKLDTCGMGRGLFDELNVEFKKENIRYGDNGVLEYDAKKVELAEKEKVKQEIQGLLDKANSSLDNIKLGSSSADIYLGHIHGIITVAHLIGLKTKVKEDENGHIVY